MHSDLIIIISLLIIMTLLGRFYYIQTCLYISCFWDYPTFVSKQKIITLNRFKTGKNLAFHCPLKSKYPEYITIAILSLSILVACLQNTYLDFYSGTSLDWVGDKFAKGRSRSYRGHHI